MYNSMKVIGLFFIVLLLNYVPYAHGFAFDLQVTKSRCFVEEVPSDTDLRVSYAALPGYAQFLDVSITDQTGHSYFSQASQDHGSFHDYISRGGEFTICFSLRLAQGVKYVEGMKRSISLDILMGSEKTDFSEFATKAKLRPIEVELHLIEDAVRRVHMEYLYYKEKEAEMRNANEWMTSMITRLLAFLIFTFFVFSMWELFYLKSYFRKKRLID